MDRGNLRGIEIVVDEEANPAVAFISDDGEVSIKSTNEAIKLLSTCPIPGIDLECLIEDSSNWYTPHMSLQHIDEIRRKLSSAPELKGSEIRDEGTKATCQLLSEIHSSICKYLKRFVQFDKEDDYHILANFVISTYFREDLRFSPLILINSAESYEKSSLLRAVERICYRGCYFSNQTSSTSLAEIVDRCGTTLLLDEGDITLRDASRAQSIYALCSDSTEYDGRVVKTGPNGRIKTKRIFTSCILATCNGALPRDITDKAIVIDLGPCTEIGALESTRFIDTMIWEDKRSSPVRIADDLYAIKALTDSLRGIDKMKDNIGCANLKPFMEKSRVHLTTNIDGRYMYAKLHGCRSVQICGKDYEIGLIYYALGLATGTDASMIRMILSNVQDASIDRVDSMESVLANSLLDLLRIRYQEISKTIRSPSEIKRLRAKQLIAIARDIPTSSIVQIYREYRHGSGVEENIEPRTLTACLKKLGIKLRIGAGNKRYLDSGDPDFIPVLVRLSNIYGTEENREYYRRMKND